LFVCLSARFGKEEAPGKEEEVDNESNEGKESIVGNEPDQKVRMAHIQALLDKRA
jgi:hypothetical protein